MAVLTTFGASLAAVYFGSTYTISIITEIAVLVIFALSIDILVGYTGLVTFGHAGFMGVGAYTCAYLSHHLAWPVGTAILGGILAGILTGFVVGFLVIRVTGVFFIMVTLAMSMMFYSWAFKARMFGADDGLTGMKRLDLAGIGIDLNDPRAFSLFCLALALLTFILIGVLVRSPFGQTLRAIKQNENRIRAQGCPVRAYKLAAFVISAAFASLAGILQLQNTLFLHPNVAFWYKSGEGLITVIIGGAGTLVGAILGTYFFVLLHRAVEAYTQFWQVWVGVAIILLLLVAPEGIHGGLRSVWLWRPGLRARLARQPISAKDDD